MAIDRCKECGANLAMVGIRHRCLPGAVQTLAAARAGEIKETKSSDGGVESRHAGTHPTAPGRKCKGARLAGVAPGPSEAKPRRGRPRLGEVRDRPWEAAGMSERTWYRRQKEKAK